jgi:hypothetical protein
VDVPLPRGAGHDSRLGSDQRWTIPFGCGIGRLVRFGKQPVDFKVQPFWYAEKPHNGPEWSLQLQVKLLFQNDSLQVTAEG